MTKWKDWIVPIDTKYWNNFLDSKYIADTKWKWKLLMKFFRYFGFKEKHTADDKQKDSTEWNPASVQLSQSIEPVQNGMNFTWIREASIVVTPNLRWY